MKGDKMTDTSAASPTRAMNILLLGPRGVGKTTWINAALNYCKYVSLQEALRADGLVYASPSAFSARAIEGENSVPVIVSTGFDEGKRVKNLNDTFERLEPTGIQSRTQKTTVHCFRLGNSAIRFIDTPGVGNPGDAVQDDDLFLDIMQTLSHNEQLHGIVIFIESTWTELSVKA